MSEKSPSSNSMAAHTRKGKTMFAYKILYVLIMVFLVEFFNSIMFIAKSMCITSQFHFYL